MAKTFLKYLLSSRPKARKEVFHEKVWNKCCLTNKNKIQALYHCQFGAFFLLNKKSQFHWRPDTGSRYSDKRATWSDVDPLHCCRDIKMYLNYWQQPALFSCQSSSIPTLVINSFTIHHSDQSTHLCARIWSDNLQDRQIDGLFIIQRDRRGKVWFQVVKIDLVHSCKRCKN